MSPPPIVLATLNAKYFHASLGLRYLLANLGDLQARAILREFTIHDRPADIAEQLLALQPALIALGVYVWNVQETQAVVAILKAVAPHIPVVLGGPEISHETDQQPLAHLADYVITGQADLEFPKLCAEILEGPPAGDRPRIRHAEPPPLDQLVLPYALYDDRDIAQRLIYVEASRGCPFKCEFCLSSLDKTAVPFDLERFLAAMADLHRRGVRQFKFVDRTFNLSVASGRRILQFFLDRLEPGLFLHFELVPDRLPAELRELLSQFPAGSLQLEIGIQSLDLPTQQRISRRQDEAATLSNLKWLRAHTQAHLHVDLIAGLPGETPEQFAAGFDRLVALDPHEIQVGILKRLRGTPIIRHTAAHQLRFDPAPPYQVIATANWPFADLQRLGRFARYWDLIGNSGRFAVARPLLLGDQPFARFMALGDWLFAHTRQTHQIALERLFVLLREGMVEALALPDAAVLEALVQDYRRSGLRGDVESLGAIKSSNRVPLARSGAERQQRHREPQADPAETQKR